MTQKNITIISEYWYPIVGGVSTYVTSFSNELKIHTNSELVNIFRKGKSKNKTEIALNNSKIIFPIRCFFQLLKLKPDIINTHGSWYINMAAVTYKILNPKTIIVQTHHTDPDKFLNGYKKLIYEKILSKYDYNVFVSNYLKHKYDYYNIKTKTKVIYGAIDISKVKPENIFEFKKKYHLKNTDKVISYIGNFAWDLKSQGVDLLIKSMSQIVEKDKSIKLLIIGQGKYQERSRKLVKKLKLEKNIIFTRNLNNVFTALKISDIYVHITYQDAFSNVVLEAMASKTPVIASNYAATKEIIIHDKTGVLTDNKEEDISEAVIRLINNKNKMKKISNNAYVRLKKDFNWKSIVSQYTELFKA